MNTEIDNGAGKTQTSMATPEIVHDREPESINHGHERKDVDVFSLFTIAFLLFLSCAIIFLIVLGMMHYFKVHEPAKTSGRADLPITRTGEFPKPRLEVKTSADLATLRAAEEADLHSYGWIDQNA